MDMRFPPNNAFPSCPASLADGRTFNPSARPKGVEDAYIRDVNGIRNIYTYNKFLQQNGLKMFNDASPSYPDCGPKVCYFGADHSKVTTQRLVSLSKENYEKYRKNGTGPVCDNVDSRVLSGVIN